MSLFTQEECELYQDAKYRNYISQVEKLLKIFESSSDWPDLINAFGKLNKLLSSNVKYAVIPKRVTIGKRLAQCIHPALPSGVHIRCIETYDLMFKTMGTSRLASDLLTYTSGILPLLQFAAIDVRKKLLALFESHFIPMNELARPAVQGLLYGLLPGLDEEGSETYEKIISLLDSLCESVGPVYFYGCLWECIQQMSLQNVRLFGLHYLYLKMDKKKSMEDQLYLIGSNVDSFVTALANSMQDSSYLTQRISLDILLCGFPIHSSHLMKNDMKTLAKSALLVVLRRDMSLNRRLYAWLLGTDSNGVPILKRKMLDDHESKNNFLLEYFDKYSKSMVIESLKDIAATAKDLTALNPFKIMMSLLDKNEISTAIIEDILLDLVRAVKRLTSTENDERKEEVIKMLHLLLGSLDESYIWQYLAKCAQNSVESDNVIEICELINVIVDQIQPENLPKIQAKYIPLLLKHLLSVTKAHVLKLSSNMIEVLLLLCKKLLMKVLPSNVQITMTQENQMSQMNESEANNVIENCINLTIDVFEQLTKRLIKFQPFENILESVLKLGYTYTASSTDGVFDKFSSDLFISFSLCCDLIQEFSTFPIMDSTKTILDKTKAAIIPNWLKLLMYCCCNSSNDPIQYRSVSCFLELICMSLSVKSALKRKAAESSTQILMDPLLKQEHLDVIYKNAQLFQILAKNLWNRLSDNNNSDKIVIIFNKLHQISPNSVCEDIIGESLVEETVLERIKAHQNFALFWHELRDIDMFYCPGNEHIIKSYDRSIIVMLDSLNAKNSPECCHIVLEWIFHSVQRGDLSRILEPLLMILLHPDTSRISLKTLLSFKKTSVKTDRDDDSIIYAISHVKGEVTYIKRNDASKQQQITKKNKNRNNNVVSTSSTITDEGRIIENRISSDVIENDYDKINPKNMKLHMNPLEDTDMSADILDFTQNVYVASNVQSATRLDKKICDAEGINFVDENINHNNNNNNINNNHQPSDSSDSTDDDATRLEITDKRNGKNNNMKPLLNKNDAQDKNRTESQKIVKEIFDDILNDVFQIAELDEPSPKQYEDDEQIFDRSDGKNSFLMVNKILLYSQKYDTERLLHCFECLKSILMSNNKLISSALVTSMIFPSYTKRTAKIIKLFNSHIESVGENTDLNQAVQQSYSLLEILTTMCLYLMRSYYPSKLPNEKISFMDRVDNSRVQIKAAEFLTEVFSQIADISLEKGDGYRKLMINLIHKCKLPSTIMHCLLTTIRRNSKFTGKMGAAQRVITINFISDEKSFQSSILKLIAVISRLEYVIYPINVVEDRLKPVRNARGGYVRTKHLVSQKIFKKSFIDTLDRNDNLTMHSEWIHLLSLIMPYCGKSLGDLVCSVVDQMCQNLQKIASKNLVTPPDYVLNHLEDLTNLVHSILIETDSDTENSILLMHQTIIKSSHTGLLDARKSLFLILFRVILSLSALWENENFSKNRNIKTAVLELISPLTKKNGTKLMTAFALVWAMKKAAKTIRISPTFTDGQLNLVDILFAIKIWPINDILGAIKTILKNPPILKTSKTLDVAVLQLFSAFLRKCSTTVAMEHLNLILQLFRECIQFPNISPQASFLFLTIIIEIVEKLQTILTTDEKKKDRKDAQETIAKLVEFIGGIAGSSLEQTTWLKRTLVVKAGRQIDIDEDIVDEHIDDSVRLQKQRHSVLALAVLKNVARLLDISFTSDEKEKTLAIIQNMLYNVLPYLKHRVPNNLPSLRAGSLVIASVSEYSHSRKTWRKDVFDILTDSSFFIMDLSTAITWKSIIDNLMTHDRITFSEFLTKMPTVTPGINLLFSGRDEMDQKAALMKRLAFIVFSSQNGQYESHLPEIQERLTDGLRMHSPYLHAQVFLAFRILLLKMGPKAMEIFWPIILTELVHVLLLIEQDLTPAGEEATKSIILAGRVDCNTALNPNFSHVMQPTFHSLYLACCKFLDLCLALNTEDVPRFTMYKWAFVGEHAINKPKGTPVGFVPYLNRIAALMNRKYGPTNKYMNYKDEKPLLTMKSIVSLQELQPFFDYIVHKVNYNNTTSLTLNVPKNSNVPKSVSAPDIRSAPFSYITCDEIIDDNLPAKEYIEKLILSDFLEPMPK